MSYSVPIGNRKMVNRCKITTLNRQYEDQQKGDEHTNNRPQSNTQNTIGKHDGRNVPDDDNLC